MARPQKLTIEEQRHAAYLANVRRLSHARIADMFRHSPTAPPRIGASSVAVIIRRQETPQ